MPSSDSTWTANLSPRLPLDLARLAAAIRFRGGTTRLPPSQLPDGNDFPEPVVWIESAEDDPASVPRPRLRLTDEPLPVGAGWNERRLPRDAAPEWVAEVAELLACAARLERERDAWKRDAHTDGLTGLLNRRGWEAAEAERAKGSAYGAGLVLLDLDDFHAVNEKRSHAAGDACLRRFGRLLLDEADRFGPGCRAVRLGGDEFALWALGVAREETADLARRVASAWNAVAVPGTPDAATTVSVGWAWSAEGIASAASEAFQAADQALLAAKRAGKARVVASS